MTGLSPFRAGTISRRDLLKALPLAASAACSPRPYRRSDFSLPPRSKVALLPATSYSQDLADLMYRGLDLLRPEVKGRSVLLKPNLVEYEAGTIINTNPAIIAGAAEAFLRFGAREVVVGEGPGHRRDIEYLLVATGLFDHLKDLRLRFIDLNHTDVRVVPLRSRYTKLESLALPVDVLQADIVVSMAKLKTHHWAGMTAGMKNLFGVVPGAVYGWPKNVLHFRGIEQAILDLNATVQPRFTIVDAIVAMEGDGPIMGKPRPVGFVAMGHDTVAVDATCARIMGLDPTKMNYLRVASEYLGNLAESRIDQIAESPARYRTRFEMLEHFRELQLAGGA
jgi:uncharacterized protein (DUF362 family)